MHLQLRIGQPLVAPKIVELPKVVLTFHAVQNPMTLDHGQGIDTYAKDTNGAAVRPSQSVFSTDDSGHFCVRTGTVVSTPGCQNMDRQFPPQASLSVKWSTI